MDGKDTFQVPARLIRSWFELTADERKAAVTIAAIFLLGVTVRVWHLHRTRAATEDRLQQTTQCARSQATDKGKVSNDEH